MKGTKRKLYLLLAAVLLLLAVSACGEKNSGSGAGSAKEDETREDGANAELLSAESMANKAPETADGDTPAAGEQTATEGQAAVGGIGSMLQDRADSKKETEGAGGKANIPPLEQSSAEGEPLTEEECADFTEYIRRTDRYGFLLSEYEAPSEINLNELLYSCAGFNNSVSKEEIQAYLKATGEDEIYTDMRKLTTEQINDFLLETIGIGYAEMEHPLDWVYLAKYDAYYLQAGDTNYMPFSCVAGTRDGEIYTLDFRPGDPDNGFFGTDLYRLTLREKGDGYQVLSHRRIKA